MTKSELIDVLVKVPADRVGPFYEMFGRWMTGGYEPDAAVAPTSSSRGTLPWGDGDLDLARDFVKKLSDRASRLFEVLGTSAPQRYTGEELANIVGIPNGRYGIAGTLAWPGRYCKAINRKLPFEFDNREAPAGAAEGEPTYYMTKQVAELFAAARAANS